MKWFLALLFSSINRSKFIHKWVVKNVFKKWGYVQTLFFFHVWTSKKLGDFPISTKMVFNTFIPFSYIDRISTTKKWVKIQFQKVRLCSEKIISSWFGTYTSQKDCGEMGFKTFILFSQKWGYVQKMFFFHVSEL